MHGLQKAKNPDFIPASERPKNYEEGYREWVEANPNAEISQTFGERAYSAGQYFGLALPTIKVPGLEKASGLTDDTARGANSTDDIVNAASKTEELANSMKPLGETDNVTLYRGTTGSESSGTTLFLTDDAAVAGSYVKNNGEVLEYSLSRVALEKLKFSDKLQTFSGKHGATGITNTEYKFLGVDLKQAINSLGQPLQK